MSPSDWINLSLSILSFLLTTISVITVVITLKHNNKMIESSNRPYIVVSGQTVNFQSPEFMIIIKNYGKSGATINQLKFDISLKKYMYALDIEPFQYISNSCLAPNQNLVCNLNPVLMGNDNIEIINCNIVYSYNGKTYNEDYIINYKALCKNISTKASTKDKEMKIISYALQEMVKKNL